MTLEDMEGCVHSLTTLAESVKVNAALAASNVTLTTSNATLTTSNTKLTKALPKNKGG